MRTHWKGGSRPGFGLLIFALCLLAAPPLYAAVSVELAGTETPENTVSVMMRYDDSQTTLILNITNTSSLPDSRFTGFAFNVPEEISDVLFFSGPVGWSYAFHPDAMDLPGSFGLFDLASVTGTNFNAGFPENGIPPGETFHFVFTLKYEELESLTEKSFTRLYSLNHDNRQKPAFFFGHFLKAEDTTVEPALPQGDVTQIPDYTVTMPATLSARGEFFDGQAFERQTPAPPVEPQDEGTAGIADKPESSSDEKTGTDAATETPPDSQPKQEQGVPLLLILVGGGILFLVIWGLFKLLLG